MAEAPYLQECLEPLVAGVHEQLQNLRKYEGTFSPESKASLQVGPQTCNSVPDDNIAMPSRPDATLIANT
eukprot:566188-Pelagomonas_calceolata.AAC.1